MSSRQVVRPALRVLLAFDSFKGSMSATEACRSAETHLQDRFGDRVSVVSTPLADGGEGSLELLQSGRAMASISVPAVDAIARPHEAEYLFDAERGTAYIEVARAIGLPDVSDVVLRPLEASSYGAGLLVADALNRGAQRLVIFLGGSATSDGGAGLLQALGARLRDASGCELERGGGALDGLAKVDVSDLLAGALSAQWQFVADVNAPLLGPTGAAQTYAPQKGATPEQVELLEAALGHASAVLEETTGRELRVVPGAGAAGGMRLFPAAFCDVEMIAGGPFLAAETGALAALQTADIVVTGEGRFDAQSLDGKVVGTLAAAADLVEPRPMLVVVAGDVGEAARLRSAGALEGVTGVFGIAESAAELVALQADAAGLLARRVAEVIAVTLAARS